MILIENLGKQQAFDWTTITKQTWSALKKKRWYIEFKSMWNTFSVYLSHSPESATDAISLHSIVFHILLIENSSRSFIWLPIFLKNLININVILYILRVF